MRVRIYAAVAVLAILVLTGFAVASWLKVREPTHGGKTLSRWLLQTPSRSARADESSSDARIALGSMGGQSVRFLWNETLATDSPFKLRLIKLARKQSIVRIDHTPANLRRMRAHAFFPLVAEWGASEIPLLLRALEDRNPDVRLRGKNCLDWVLYKADPNASASELIACMKRRNATMRKHAAFAFRRVPTPAGTNGFPLLQLAALKDRSTDVRANAAMALGGIRPTNKGVTETLIAAMRDRQPIVRRAAILAVAEIGPEAQAARPELVRMLDQQNAEFAAELKEALAKTASREALRN